MGAQTVNRQPISISLKALLLVYLLLPALWLMMWADTSLFHHQIMMSLPFKPELWVMWAYVFGMPHIFASMQTFAEREYLQFYGRRLGLSFAVFLALPFAVLHFYGTETLFWIFTAFIVYHAIAQQFGITLLALGRAPNLWFYLWKWTSLAACYILYFQIYTTPTPLALDPVNPLRVLLLDVAWVLLAAATVAAILFVAPARKNMTGLAHVVCNVAMMTTAVVAFDLGYFILVVIIGRVIHEFTAWPLYAAHDHNRARSGGKNWIYQLLGFTRLPVFAVSILVAFALGVAMTLWAKHVPTIAVLMVALSLTHYYIESFLWRRNTIHRQNLSFHG